MAAVFKFQYRFRLLQALVFQTQGQWCNWTRGLHIQKYNAPATQRRAEPKCIAQNSRPVAMPQTFRAGQSTCSAHMTSVQCLELVPYTPPVAGFIRPRRVGAVQSVLQIGQGKSIPEGHRKSGLGHPKSLLQAGIQIIDLVYRNV